MGAPGSSRPQRLIVGISGASGAVYGVRLLELLRDTPIETHLVVSKSALITLAHETEMSWSRLKTLLTSATSIKTSARPLPAARSRPWA